MCSKTALMCLADHVASSAMVCLCLSCKPAVKLEDKFFSRNVFELGSV